MSYTNPVPSVLEKQALGISERADVRRLGVASSLQGVYGLATHDLPLPMSAGHCTSSLQLASGVGPTPGNGGRCKHSYSNPSLAGRLFRSR